MVDGIRQVADHSRRSTSPLDLESVEGLRGGFLNVCFDDLWKSVNDRLHRLVDAEEMVVEDPEILDGTPVIRGTRIPVYSVATLFDAGTSIQEIREMYPRLTAVQVELASIYAKAVPQRGRPKRKDYAAGTKLLSVKRGDPKSRIAG